LFEEFVMPRSRDISLEKSIETESWEILFDIGRIGLDWRNPKGLVLRCVDHMEAKRFMIELHSGLCGGHYATRTTTHKILREGYYWPGIFVDVHAFVRSCQPSQFFVGKQQLAALPLQCVVIEAPFQQWGLHFI
jgi:hypothetical protein